jgi:uncharacterized protein (DUF1778 family)
MVNKSASLASRPLKRRKALRDRKEDLIQIRVTSGQRERLKEAADRAGLDLSSWMRMVGLRAANDQKQ